MLLRRKRFKKENPKQRLKKMLFVLSFVMLLLLTPSFLYIFYYYGGYYYINPLALNNSSKNRLEDILKKNKIEFVNIVINPDKSESVDLKIGGQVIFSTNKDLDGQVASLQLMLSRLTIEGKKLKTLDFRYSSPVVTFN